MRVSPFKCYIRVCQNKVSVLWFRYDVHVSNITELYLLCENTICGEGTQNKRATKRNVFLASLLFTVMRFVSLANLFDLVTKTTQTHTHTHTHTHARARARRERDREGEREREVISIILNSLFCV